MPLEKPLTPGRLRKALAKHNGSTTATAWDLGCCVDTVRKFRDRFKGDGHEMPSYFPKKTEKDYMPTEEEIKAACLKLQETWTEAEFRSRAGIIDCYEPEVQPHPAKSDELFGY